MTDQNGSSERVEFVSDPEIGNPAVSSALDLSLGALAGSALGLLAVLASIWGSTMGPGYEPFPSLFGSLPFIVPLAYVIGGALAGAALGGRFQPAARLQRKGQRGQMLAKVARMIEEHRAKPLSPIAEVRNDERIRGRVRVLEAPPGEQPNVALSLANGRRFGRFVIVDGTGEALVDDDMIELFSERDEHAVVRDGDWIEASAPIAEVSDSARGAGYRGGPRTVELRGTPRDKIVILAVASPANVRVALDQEQEHEIEAASEPEMEAARARR